MYEYRNIDWLSHHGVQGQRWGHRNGPPYPLSREISTGSRLKENGRLTGKINVKRDRKTGHIEYTHKRPLYVQPIPGIKTKRRKPPYTLNEDVEAVNPKFNSGEKYQTNCCYCTLTTEMRCRGYDVEALPVNKKYKDYAYAAEFKDLAQFNGLFHPPVKPVYGIIIDKNKKEINTKPTKEKTEHFVKEVKSRFDKMPNNARGELAVYYYWDNHNDGHSVFFEKTNEGKTVIIDSQSDNVYYFEDFKDIWSYVSSASIVRFDNRDIDINKVKDFCK